MAIENKYPKLKNLKKYVFGREIDCNKITHFIILESYKSDYARVLDYISEKSEDAITPEVICGIILHLNKENMIEEYAFTEETIETINEVWEFYDESDDEIFVNYALDHFIIPDEKLSNSYSGVVDINNEWGILFAGKFGKYLRKHLDKTEDYFNNNYDTFKYGTEYKKLNPLNFSIILGVDEDGNPTEKHIKLLVNYLLRKNPDFNAFHSEDTLLKFKEMIEDIFEDEEPYLIVELLCQLCKDVNSIPDETYWYSWFYQIFAEYRNETDCLDYNRLNNLFFTRGITCGTDKKKKDVIKSILNIIKQERI